jgi:hypothetical protein
MEGGGTVAQPASINVTQQKSARNFVEKTACLIMVGPRPACGTPHGAFPDRILDWFSFLLS